MRGTGKARPCFRFQPSIFFSTVIFQGVCPTFTLPWSFTPAFTASKIKHQQLSIFFSKRFLVVLLFFTVKLAFFGPYYTNGELLTKCVHVLYLMPGNEILAFVQNECFEKYVLVFT